MRRIVAKLEPICLFRPLNDSSYGCQPHIHMLARLYYVIGLKDASLGAWAYQLDKVTRPDKREYHRYSILMTKGAIRIDEYSQFKDGWIERVSLGRNITKNHEVFEEINRANNERLGIQPKQPG